MARKSLVQSFVETLERVRSEPEPGYFLYGGEIYLQDRFLEAVFQGFQDRYGERWNKYVYHASEMEAETILGQLVGESLFTDPKVVVIKEVNELEGSGQQAVQDYLQNPGNDLVLVLQQESSRFSGKWVTYFLRQHDLEAGQAVQSRLIDLAGESLKQLESEINKLRIYLAEDEQQLTEELLSEIVGESRSHSVFELKDALGTKSLEEILQQLYSLLEEGEDVSYIVRTTADFYAELWAVKAMDAAGADQRAMNKEVFHGRNLAWKYRKFLGRFSEEEIRRAFPLLEEADLISKSTSALDAKNYLTGFYYELLRVRKESIYG